MSNPFGAHDEAKVGWIGKQAVTQFYCYISNSSVLLLIPTSALKNIPPPCDHLIWAIRHIRPLLSVDTTFSLAWITIPCNSLLYGTSASLIHSLQRKQNKLVKLVLLNPPLIALTAWSNCTGYRSIIASSSKSPSWRIEFSRHPIHPISTTSFSAAMHLVFVHLPPVNYANQFTNHPSSTEASHMPLLLSGTHYPLLRAQPSLELSKRNLKPTKTWLCKWRITN